MVKEGGKQAQKGRPGALGAGRMLASGATDL